MSERPPLQEPYDASRDRGRRLSFGSVAERYDRHRPGYPPQLVDAVLEYAGARPGDRILDVGAGTGRATLLFARRGFALTAIEPDPDMAAVASRRAAAAGLAVEIIGGDFEQVTLPAGTFQALVSGTAWHWVTPGLRNRLAARVLAPGGALAPFWNRPQWQGSPLRDSLEAVYADLEREFASRPGGPMNPLGAPLEIRSARDWLEHEFHGCPDFTDLETRVFEWRQRYTRAEYLALLSTHSDHILLAEAARERLLAGVGAAIDAAGGSFELTYQALLCLARRRAT